MFIVVGVTQAPDGPYAGLEIVPRTLVAYEDAVAAATARLQKMEPYWRNLTDLWVCEVSTDGGIRRRAKVDGYSGSVIPE